MTRIVREFRTTRELERQASDAAHTRKQSRSSFIGDILTAYAEGRLNFPRKRVNVMDRTVRYTSPESYDSALKRAQDEGISISEVIRHGIITEYWGEEE